MAVTAGDGQRVPGAVVTLIDSLYEPRASALTDTRGRFHLEAPEPGSYFLLLERGAHASELSQPFMLLAGETLDYRMEVEGVSTERIAELHDLRVRRKALTEALLDRCAEEPGEVGHAVLSGVVRDSVSGVVLPRVRIVVEWEEGEETRQREALARSDGTYTACGLPGGLPVALAVRDFGGGAPLAELVRDSGVVHLLDLPVDGTTLSSGAGTGKILGRVKDETGRLVSGAEVWVEGEGARTVTNARGVFLLRDVRAGPLVLVVEHLGYGTQARGLVVRGGRAHDVDIRLLTEPIELEPITVTVRSRNWFGDMVDLQHRMDLGFGHFLTREDFEARAQMPLGWAMSGIPGVRIIDDGLGTFVRFRRAPRTAACREGPVVYLDGMKYRLSQRGFDEFNTSDLEAVELYAGPAQTPGQFSGSDAQCGVVVIWTRRPGSF